MVGAPGARALPSDREQPIEIVADRASLDQRAGIAVYTGRVRLTQGTLRVDSERMTIWLEDEEVQRIRAEGDEARQARYEQQPEAGAARVRADADVILYLVDRQRVRLRGDAVLVQAGDRFEGEALRYDITEQLVLAGGPDPDAEADGEPGAAPAQRIRMTLQPRGPRGAPPGPGTGGPQGDPEARPGGADGPEP